MLNVLESKEPAVKHSIRQRCDGVPNMQPGKMCGVIYIRKRTSSSFYVLQFAQLKFSVSGGYENSNHWQRTVRGNTNILQYFSKTREPLEYIVNIKCNTSSKNISALLERARLLECAGDTCYERFFHPMPHMFGI